MSCVDPEELCIDLEKNLEDLLSDLAGFQSDLQSAPTQAKSALMGVIKKLNVQIGKKEVELAACYAAKNISNLETTLMGTAKLTTTYPNAPGPYNLPIKVALTFFKGRRKITLYFGPFVAAKFSTPLGENVTTIKLNKYGGEMGDFNRKTGEMCVFLSLLFDQSVRILADENSLLNLELNTDVVDGMQGIPLNRNTRELTLVGKGQFEGGALDKQYAELTITGTIADLP